MSHRIYWDFEYRNEFLCTVVAESYVDALCIASYGAKEDTVGPVLGWRVKEGLLPEFLRCDCPCCGNEYDSGGCSSCGAGTTAEKSIQKMIEHEGTHNIVKDILEGAEEGKDEDAVLVEQVETGMEYDRDDMAKYLEKDEQWLENATRKEILQEMQCLRQANVSVSKTLVSVEQELLQAESKLDASRRDYHRQNQELLQVAMSLASVQSEKTELLAELLELKSSPVAIRDDGLIHPSAENNGCLCPLFWIAIGIGAIALGIALWKEFGL